MPEKQAILLLTVRRWDVPQNRGKPRNGSGYKNFAAAADLIYNPAETEFLCMARTCGKTAVNGLLMLAAQAVAAQEIWQQRKLGTDLAVKIMQRLAEK